MPSGQSQKVVNIFFRNCLESPSEGDENERKRKPAYQPSEPVARQADGGSGLRGQIVSDRTQSQGSAAPLTLRQWTLTTTHTDTITHHFFPLTLN